MQRFLNCAWCAGGLWLWGSAQCHADDTIIEGGSTYAVLADGAASLKLQVSMMPFCCRHNLQKVSLEPWILQPLSFSAAHSITKFFHMPQAGHAQNLDFCRIHHGSKRKITWSMHGNYSTTQGADATSCFNASVEWQLFQHAGRCI